MRFAGCLALALCLIGCTNDVPVEDGDASMQADSGATGSDGSITVGRDGGVASDGATSTADLGASLGDASRDSATASSGGSCPGSTGTVGVDSCDYVPNITLYDCDGNPVELHSLCDTELSYVYTYAHWCPNCIDFATNRANSLYAGYRESVGDFQMYFVITQTREYTAPTAEFCRAVRDQYGLTMPVLFDPLGVTNSVLGMRINTADMVLRRGGLIVINGPWAEFTVTTAIEGGYGECCTSCRES